MLLVCYDKQLYFLFKKEQVFYMSKKAIQFVDRELSWLSFNERVLQEAEDKSVPLLMRIKFLGIFSSNQDEFFRVRVATLRRIVSVNKEAKIALGFSPKKILKQIHKQVLHFQKRFERIYADILKELATHNIFIINEKELNETQGKLVKSYFHSKVRPSLVPLMISDIPEFPHLKGGAIYLAVHLAKTDGTEITRYALIELPTADVSRFLVLEKTEGKTYIILLDDVIRYCLEEIFAIFGYDDCKAYTIKITKDAETDIDNDVSKSFLELIASSIKQRKHGSLVRFIHDENIEPDLLQFLTERFNLKKDDTQISAGRYHNFKDFMGFPNLDKPELDNPPFEALRHQEIEATQSLFQMIKQQDLMLHFPYQSYLPVIDLLREAAIDPRVEAIKMTLYRVAKRSNIINALINARKNGKKVVVVLELQARFDEAANIAWAKTLQESGIIVQHGPQSMKIHAKLCLIGRREDDGQLKYYGCIGTGNFNEDTAKLYADTVLFTAHEGITKDLRKVFKAIGIAKQIPTFEHLVVSPYYLYDTMCAFIDAEIAHTKAGKIGHCIIKLNSLSDEGIIKKLYEASAAGVKVQLIVRGICSLIPQKEGLSENIEAVSIVDRFLEHARVYWFANDGNERCYIASADWMERNLHRRIEVACPIYDAKNREEIKMMLDLQLQDNQKARYIKHDETNVYKRNDSAELRSQKAIYQYFNQKFNDNV